MSATVNVTHLYANTTEDHVDELQDALNQLDVALILDSVNQPVLFPPATMIRMILVVVVPRSGFEPMHILSRYSMKIGKSMSKLNSTVVQM